jgi:hypothetical protein
MGERHRNREKELRLADSQGVDSQGVDSPEEDLLGADY